MNDLRRMVSDRLVLRTVPGAVDYLAEELRAVPGVTVERRRRDGVVVWYEGPLEELARVRYFMSAALPLPQDAVDCLTASPVVEALDAPVRFRVGEIGSRRWELRDALTARGWVNAPGDWDVNIEADGEALAAEIGCLYWTKRFGELARAPAATNPQIATVMVRLAKIETGHTVCDPMCGSGTLLALAADMARPARLLGGDHDPRWVDTAARNLTSRGAAHLLWQGDAKALPLRDDSVDRVLANLPFGKRVGSHINNQQLYPQVLAQLTRVLSRKGRAVLLTEDKRLFVESVQRTRGIRIIKQVAFESGGAHPSAYVVTTRRTR